MFKLSILFSLAFFLLSTEISAQTNNPIPEKIRPSGLLYELEEVATIRASNNEAPFARINMLREAPDKSGRLFVIDLNGFLWMLDKEEQHLFLKIKDYTSKFISAPGKGTGFGAFAFHPDYQDNGKFYTSHAELPESNTPDYSPPAGGDISMQWVLMEWTMNAPEATSFLGTSRELLRVDYPAVLHGIQDIQFNPNAAPDDPDYGVLYVCFGDGGSSLNFQEQNIQNKSSFLGTIFRIDPLGNNGPNGEYGIPIDNPFVGEGDVLEEIYCFGFRNPHRISWDTGEEQFLLIADIGEKNLEEINIGYSGANYGWGKREGTFVYDRSKGRELVYPLPANDEEHGFTYPVAQYDHDEGLAIVGGYVYRGNLFPQLQGHYIFGDIPSGRVFHVPVENFKQGNVAQIKELNFIDAERDRTTFRKLTTVDRADLRFGIDSAGEIYFLTKADGKIRRLKPQTSTSVAEYLLTDTSLDVFPNPFQELLQFSWPDEPGDSGLVEIYNISSGALHSVFNVQRNNQSLDLSTLAKGIYLIRLKIENFTFSARIIKQ